MSAFCLEGHPVGPESIVYGSIRNWPSGDAERCRQRRRENRRALDRLPLGESWHFIGRWESESGYHSPDQRDLRMRCAWERDGGMLG